MVKKWHFGRKQTSRHDYELEQSADPRLRMLIRVRKAVGSLLIAVTVLFILLHIELFTPSSLSNIRSSLEAASSASAGDTTVISYSNGTPRSITPFGSGLAVCSDQMLSFQLPSSYCQMETSLSYADPVMRASRQYLLIYDRGAYRFTVANTLSELYSLTMQSPVTNADIAANGSVAVVTAESGYKSAVTVYNIDHEQLYKWSSADYYIMSAALSGDGQRLALFCFKQDGLTLTSKLFFTNIDSDQSPEESTDMNGSLVLGMQFLGNNTVGVVCDNAAYVVSRSGQIHYQTEYSEDSLYAFDFSDDRLVLAVKSFAQGSRADITLLNSRGMMTREPLSISAEPDSVSFYDGRLAVLTGDTVTFYSQSLRQIDQQSGLSGVSRVYMRSGGTAIALFGSQARVLTIGKPLKDFDEAS